MSSRAFKVWSRRTKMGRASKRAFRKWLKSRMFNVRRGSWAGKRRYGQ